MGSVFGKETVKEPPFEVILQRNTGKTPYELRKYGTRYAASVEYASDDTSTPFGTLAKYIGVFGTPQNEGSTSIAMTAPVVMEQEPTAIAMTAPVVMESDGKMKKMMFMLPVEYDDLAKIPKPTNPAVHIEEIPSEVGAVHRYNGIFNTKINREKAKEMGAQLISDQVPGITEEFVLENFQFWGYNPPFTIPYFRRNEVWLKLNDEQVNYLKDKFPNTSEGRLRGGSSSASMNGRTMFTFGFCGLVVGAFAVGFIFRSKSQYRRL
ncbi:hypothetical protein ACHAW5_010374 [Stephanodiscus triporus]|uniref:SOUL heme-binding protein n=1 Tax=Stephanodiscus triporus TaxID=2934178 RepID=A0ABD3PBK1_9STRA